jgi:hypothetical protein
MQKPRPRMEDVLRPTQSRTKEQKHDSLKMLLQAALAEPTSLTSSSTDSSPGSSKENHSRQMNGETEGSHEKEAKQFRAIKRLMELKGHEAMMKFLES